MTDDEILMQIDRDAARKNETVRQMLLAAGRPDLVADLDKRLRDIRLGLSQAGSIWHSISEAQRRVLKIMETGRNLRRSPGSRTRYDAYGEPHALSRVCSIATVRNLCSRDLLHVDGGALDPERKIILTEHGRFVLKHGPEMSKGWKP